MTSEQYLAANTNPNPIAPPIGDPSDDIQNPSNNLFDSLGNIDPPEPIKNLIGTDQTGAGGISLFLSNVVALIYNIAAIVVVIMLVWGALEWMLSGGDKEKVASAQRRITHAIIGLALLAVVFAILQVLEIFTGFNFFGL